MVTTMQREYQEVLKRQNQMALELDLLKKLILADDEINIKPSVLKKWERISRNLDRGRGRVFYSLKDMRTWLAKL